MNDDNLRLVYFSHSHSFSLPGVMIGSVSVSITGTLLDVMSDNEAGWRAVYQLNAAVCMAGALCFLLLYDSKAEFE